MIVAGRACPSATCSSSELGGTASEVSQIYSPRYSSHTLTAILRQIDYSRFNLCLPGPFPS